ncbi:MAG: metallophosphoesterase [Hyphomicrobiales bacterium]|nr:metallophosphoesterase [Hyphomicrobiales bacterium]
MIDTARKTADVSPAAERAAKAPDAAPAPLAGGAPFRFALVADLHFGSVPDGLAAALHDDLAESAPDLVIIAGDLTLRARSREFDAAREWLDALKTEKMVLPGNHDLPYVNLWERFFNPYRRFSALGGGPLEPVYDAGAVVIAGLNTTRSWQPHLKWQEGVARPRGVAAAVERLSGGAPQTFRAVVSHHPLSLGANAPPYVRPAIGAEAAVNALTDAGAELFMSGHVHRGFAHAFEAAGAPRIALGAPTALSNRLRGEPNGYWLAEIGADQMRFLLRRRGEARFGLERDITFPRRAQSHMNAK